MNPIKNKKDLEASIDEIRKFAYTYLEKYSSSKQQLKTYLFKKCLRKKQKIYNKRELLNLIDAVISTLEDQKILSDSYYSDSKNIERITKKQIKKYQSLASERGLGWAKIF